jgi:hypothetical protein
MADLVSLLGATGIGGAVGKAIVELQGDSLKCQDQLRLS